MLTNCEPPGTLRGGLVSDSSINKLISVDYIAMFVGFTLMIVAITGVLVARKWPGRPLAVAIYTVLLFGMMGGLIFVSIFTLSASSGRVLFGIESKLERAWINTVKLSHEDACEIQRDFDCFGFYDNQCKGCNVRNGTSATCTAEKRGVCPYCEVMPERVRKGCYGAFMKRAKDYYRPTGIVAACVSGVLLVDSFVVCAM